MRHRAVRALAFVLAAGLSTGGCAAAAGGTPATRSAARPSAPAYGPPAPDPACVAALKAQRALQARQDKDQGNQSALDRDFTDFAGALSAAAGQETHPATAKAMTALASDYTAMVESQSGTAQLPSINTVEHDGAAFTKAC